MTEQRWQEIWMVQSEAAQGVLQRFAVESAFDCIVGEKPVSFARAAADAPELSIEGPEALAERARQPGLLRELPFAPALGTS